MDAALLVDFIDNICRRHFHRERIFRDHPQPLDLPDIAFMERY